MKKKLCMLLLGLCLISMSACQNKEEAKDSDDTSVSSHNKETSTKTDNDNLESSRKTETSTKEEGNGLEKIKINIEDIIWSINEGIVDGDRYILMNYTNNTSYTITDFEIVFKEREDITEEEKTVFYSDIQKIFESSEEELAEVKAYPISMHTEVKRVADSGETIENIKCFYYRGYYYLKNINHYNLVKPDIITVKYIDEDKIYTVYYDYNSKKQFAESKTEAAYQWSQTSLGNKIPKPDTKVLESRIDMEDYFSFDAYSLSLEQFNAYIQKCKSLGYIIDSSEHEGFYAADNTEGYHIYLSYDEDDYMISGRISASDEELEDEEENNSFGD